MKKLFLAFCAAFVGLAMLSFDAQAKRLGGGGSVGMQRNATVMPKQAAPAPTAPATTPAKPAATPQAPAPQPSGMSRWVGPLAGLAAGIGLAALFSHFGIGEGMGSMLMILLLVVGVVLAFRMFARRAQPQNEMRYAGAGADAAPARFEPVGAMGGGAAAQSAPEAAPGNIPAGFDVDGFLRNAKLNFVRLQAANDAGNIEDIRQFTTPEMFAEAKLELDERGKAAQHTDVVQLHAQLLDVASEEKRHVASVRFYGLIREEKDAAPQSFDEVWHMTKPVDGSTGWVVAGIQQVQ